MTRPRTQPVSTSGKSGSAHKELDEEHRLVFVIHHNSTVVPVAFSYAVKADVEGFQPVPGATSYNFLSKIDENSDVDYTVLSTVRKGASSLGNLCSLLGYMASATFRNRPQLGNTVFSFQRAFPMIPGDAAFISCNERNGTEVYTKLRLQLPSGVLSTQFFHLRCSAIKRPRLGEPLPTNLGQIAINGGICLFSERVLRHSPGNGQAFCSEAGWRAVPPQPANVHLTLYELETASRLSSAIADVAYLIRQSPDNRDTPLSINFDIPDFQYYWAACELLVGKQVTVGCAQAWVAAIDERKAALQRLISSLLGEMLRDRQLSDVSIEFPPTAEAASQVLKKGIEDGKVPSVGDIMTALESGELFGTHWREFLRHLDARPSTVSELGRLTYVFNMVRHALEPNGRAKTVVGAAACRGRTLIIQVDDITECKILDKSARFLRRYLSHRPGDPWEAAAIGLFPIPRIFSAGPGRSDLYHADPEPSLRWHSTGTLVRPTDIVGGAYGLSLRKHVLR